MTATRIACSVALFCLAGCGGEDGGGGGTDPIAIPDMMVDMAPVEEVDPARDFCRARAEAACAWGFECLGGGGALTAFDLGGATEGDCADVAFDQCYPAVRDQLDRGTAELSVEGGEVCATRLRAAPCLDTPSSMWVGQWQDYVQQWCGNVVRGIVPSGEGCAVQGDCGALEDACIDGVCAPIPADTLIQTCDARGNLGVPQADDSCATGTCVPLQVGAICSAACNGGRGCGLGGVCLRATVLGGTVRPYCARDCAREDDPACGDLACNTLTDDPEDMDRVCEPVP